MVFGECRVRLFLRRAAWEVPVMTGPDEGGLAGRGHLRAAQADREQTITVLKAAYAQGRLTKDELEARAGQAFVSRTYAELAALTADLPADVPAVSTAATGSDAAWPPPSTPARTLAKAARRSGVCLLVAIALVEGAYLAGNFLLIVAAFFALIAASGFFGYGILDAWQERRSHAQLPPGRVGGTRDPRVACPTMTWLPPGSAQPARRNPRRLTRAAAGAGSASHLPARYPGSGPAAVARCLHHRLCTVISRTPVRQMRDRRAGPGSSSAPSGPPVQRYYLNAASCSSRTRRSSIRLICGKVAHRGSLYP
jgi:hypothetical protein